MEDGMSNIISGLIARGDRDGYYNNGGCGMWIILFMLMIVGGFGGGFGWGNRGMQVPPNVATTQEVAASAAFQQTDNAIRAVERGQYDLGYHTLDHFNRTDMLVQGVGANLQKDIAQAAFASKECCCETNRNIDSAKYDTNRNIDQSRYESAKETCAITAHDTANTQRVLDYLCQLRAEMAEGFHKVSDDAKDNIITQLRTDLQSAQSLLGSNVLSRTIIDELRQPQPRPAYIVNPPFNPVGYGGGYYGNGTTFA